MLSDGRIIYDISGEERDRLEVGDLVRKFKETVGKDLDDKILLSV